MKVSDETAHKLVGIVFNRQRLYAIDCPAMSDETLSAAKRAEGYVTQITRYEEDYGAIDYPVFLSEAEAFNFASARGLQENYWEVMQVISFPVTMRDAEIAAGTAEGHRELYIFCNDIYGGNVPHVLPQDLPLWVRALIRIWEDDTND